MPSFHIGRRGCVTLVTGDFGHSDRVYSPFCGDCYSFVPFLSKFFRAKSCIPLGTAVVFLSLTTTAMARLSMKVFTLRFCAEKVTMTSVIRAACLGGPVEAVHFRFFFVLRESARKKMRGKS